MSTTTAPVRYRIPEYVAFVHAEEISEYASVTTYLADKLTEKVWGVVGGASPGRGPGRGGVMARLAVPSSMFIPLSPLSHTVPPL